MLLFQTNEDGDGDGILWIGNCIAHIASQWRHTRLAG